MYDETAQVDLQLLLSHIQLRDEAKVIVDRAIVAMPPTQAKLLSVVLSDNVKNGKLPTEKSKLRHLNSH